MDQIKLENSNRVDLGSLAMLNNSPFATSTHHSCVKEFTSTLCKNHDGWYKPKVIWYVYVQMGTLGGIKDNLYFASNTNRTPCYEP